MKTVKLVAKKDTLALDENGRKVRVKQGEVFTTSQKTADMYIKIYRNVFEIADSTEDLTGLDTEDKVKEKILDLETQNDELIKENEELEKERDEYKEKYKIAQLELFRLVHDGKELEDIPLNDLRLIAKLKGVEIKEKNPKKQVLVDAIRNFIETENEEAENTENTADENKTEENK